MLPSSEPLGRLLVNLLLRIFTNNILPAFLVMGVGVLLDRKLGIDKKHLSRLSIYVLAPCLIFNLISQSTVDPRQFGLLILYAILTTVVMCLVGLVVGRLLRWPPTKVDGLILSIAFLNAGNLGLSVVLFTYGEPGLALASIYFVASSMTTYTLATFFANRSKGSMGAAARQVFSLPAPYAFALALLLRWAGWSLPQVLAKPVSLIAGAAVPTLLMMLGLQLSQTPIGRRYKDVAVGVFLRLIVGAGVAIVLAAGLGLQGLTRRVAIVESSTPTAVTSALLAIEFDADAEFVTSVIFFSTLFSALTLTGLISLLEG